jgi:hypothetical protein
MVVGVICMQAVGSRDMFSSDPVNRHELLISDELHAKFTNAKLVGPAFDGASVKVIDKDWVPEGQRPEWIE